MATAAAERGVETEAMAKAKAAMAKAVELGDEFRVDCVALAVAAREVFRALLCGEGSDLGHDLVVRG